METIYSSVQYIKGVGPKKAKILKKIGIQTIEDLILYFPKSYEDRREIRKISSLENGERASIKVILCNTPKLHRTKKSMTIIKALAKDDTGTVNLIWFNQRYVVNNIKIGDILYLNGRVKKAGNYIEIHNPIFEKADKVGNQIGRIIPKYRVTEGITNNEMTKIIDTAIKLNQNCFVEAIPQYIVKKLGLISFSQAIENIHFPKDRRLYLKAKERLTFEELFILQLGLLYIKQRNKENLGIKFQEDNGIIKDFIESLPFKLTRAQIRVFNEIKKDMESSKQMNRLVQGDVGSGKTIIAVLAMLKAFNSGYQSVMMAPTEILAAQHYESIHNLLSKYNIRCELLVSSISKKRKNEILDKIYTGEIDIVIGTHAVIQENVRFQKLGLAITDEQHRFGVTQRALLSLKGSKPDVIVMTATPIPRTLALILYGDLDVSIIDELPEGRKKIKTYVIKKEMKSRAYSFIKEQVKLGMQAYIVCPLIEESESMNIQSAVELYDRLKESYFGDLRLGLLHGQMKGDEKEFTMAKFKNGEIDVLISTTVVEVGVNVPNASVMMIENAERFGLAQLHQLRGRVGRGNNQSYCILVNESSSSVSKKRMSIMQETNNGFIVAEKDLEIRGPGEFFGTKQHGLPELKIANIFSDMKILSAAQTEAMELLNKDPKLKSYEYNLIREKILKLFNKKSKIISFN